MAEIEHNLLSGTELHENKGVAAASNNTVATASSGATVWQKVNANMIDTSSIKNSNLIEVTMYFADVGTATSHFIVFPIAGTITKIYVVVDGNCATSDTILTSKIGGAAITSGAITITSAGSVAGSVFSSTPSALNTVTAGQAVEVASDGATTSTVSATISFLVSVA